MSALIVGIAAGAVYVGCVLCCNGISKCRERQKAHHQDDVFNISGRVQGQEQQNSDPDAYLSIDHITITNQMNKPNYDDAPPSYEEAMRIAIAQSIESSGSSEVPTVVVVPKTTD